jgi:hypothetical protein
MTPWLLSKARGIARTQTYRDLVEEIAPFEIEIALRTPRFYARASTTYRAK